MKSQKIFSCIFRICGIATAFVLFYKVHLLNDLHCTLAQDPLENWIALGIAYILIDRSLLANRTKAD